MKITVEINKEVYGFSSEVYLEDKVENIIETLQKLLADYVDKYSDLRLDYRRDYYGEEKSYVLIGDREETPKEVDKREESEMESRLKTAAREKLQYETLKRKFG